MLGGHQRGLVLHIAYLEHQCDVVERHRPDVATQSNVDHYRQKSQHIEQSKGCADEKRTELEDYRGGNQQEERCQDCPVIPAESVGALTSPTR